MIDIVNKCSETRPYERQANVNEGQRRQHCDKNRALRIAEYYLSAEIYPAETRPRAVVTAPVTAKVL